ncbi:hypothetical protein NPIL_169411 [Nephila pilipes]|uniref:Uncharacterized protein n=1 Tax=Nephila pilipes TaxID=299642 RepID=A0A8X6TZK1_NEPPI|nr:hypothetical protein NPIL_169411 [Nephila pilipes]
MFSNKIQSMAVQVQTRLRKNYGTQMAPLRPLSHMPGRKSVPLSILEEMNKFFQIQPANLLRRHGSFVLMDSHLTNRLLSLS